MARKEIFNEIELNGPKLKAPESYTDHRILVHRHT